MATAYQHRSMSKILAPTPDPAVETPTGDKPAVVPEVKELADKYQGKTVEQVAEMHLNAEQRLGQIQNELGTMRGLVSDLSALQRTAPEPKPEEQETVDVSSDDILSDPVEAVRKIVQPQLDAVQAKQEATAHTNLVLTESAALEAQYGDLDTTVASEEFQAFATRTPGRQADFQTAANGQGLDQVRAARRLLEDFTDFKEATSTEKKTELTPLDQAKAVITESAGTGAPISAKPQIFESDVIKLINSDPAKYRSPSFQTELYAAIKEKRYVANS